MKKTNKYYVVWKGAKTGIFTSWDECQQYVIGIPGAKFKAFSSLEEAEQAFEHGDIIVKAEIKTKKYIEESISVDAACSGNPGQMEYKGVCTKTGQQLFHFGPVLGTNNIGEFLAIVHGLAWLKQKGKQHPIYSDSETAIKWVKAKKAKTSLVRNEDTERVWQLIDRAEHWLKINTFANPILKWETDKWGEIKADFGRK